MARRHGRAGIATDGQGHFSRRDQYRRRCRIPGLPWIVQQRLGLRRNVAQGVHDRCRSVVNEDGRRGYADPSLGRWPGHASFGRWPGLAGVGRRYADFASSVDTCPELTCSVDTCPQFTGPVGTRPQFASTCPELTSTSPQFASTCPQLTSTSPQFTGPQLTSTCPEFTSSVVTRTEFTLDRDPRAEQHRRSGRYEPHGRER
jgi:hypothetical protein